MQVPKGALIAVADGEKLSLFRNSGDETNPKLTPMPHTAVDASNKGSGGHHGSSSANPDNKRLDEDGHAAGTAALLNKQAVEGKLTDLIIIADPKTLGEMRKHYHAKLTCALLKEIPKDLTGHTSADIEKTLSAA